LANLAHILLAFHFIHDWNHHLALSAIARKTYEQTGLDTGIGLYINYLFASLWLVDAAFWWLFPVQFQRRPRWLDFTIHFTFLFMFINATVVFGKSSFHLFGALICLWATLGWFQGKRPFK